MRTCGASPVENTRRTLLASRRRSRGGFRPPSRNGRTGGRFHTQHAKPGIGRCHRFDHGSLFGAFRTQPQCLMGLVGAVMRHPRHPRHLVHTPQAPQAPQVLVPARPCSTPSSTKTWGGAPPGKTGRNGRTGHRANRRANRGRRSCSRTPRSLEVVSMDTGRS